MILNMSLPQHFCWTRFGTEAGEGIESIILRKEEERRINGGVFLWGIGNGIGPSMRELLRMEPAPEVIFSPIRSAPRKSDVVPEQVVVWTAARTLSGDKYQLPQGTVVTSRVSGGLSRSRHYALVCSAETPLRINCAGEELAFGRLRNIITDRSIGASQVTAVVRHASREAGESPANYPVAMRAWLVFPHFVELTDPLVVPPAFSNFEIATIRSVFAI